MKETKAYEQMWRVLVVCVLGLSSSCQKNSDPVVPSFARLSQVKKEVFEKRATDLTFVPASEGDALEKGDFVETKDASNAEVLYRANGNLVSIGEHTLIKIDEGQTAGKKSERRSFDLATLKHGDIEATTKDREMWVAVSSGIVQLGQKSKSKAKVSVSNKNGSGPEKIKIEVTSGEAVIHRKNPEGKVVSDKVQAGSPMELVGSSDSNETDQNKEQSLKKWVDDLSESDVPEVELSLPSVKSEPSISPMAPHSPEALPSVLPSLKSKSITDVKSKVKSEVTTMPSTIPSTASLQVQSEPKFSILDPKESFIETSQETYNVRGSRIGSIESVYVNSEKLDFDSEGLFSKDVALKMGTNVLLFRIEYSDKSKDPLFIKKTIFRKGG